MSGQCRASPPSRGLDGPAVPRITAHRGFLALAGGQLVSTLGFGMTRFGLGLWVLNDEVRVAPPMTQRCALRRTSARRLRGLRGTADQPLEPALGDGLRQRKRLGAHHSWRRPAHLRLHRDPATLCRAGHEHADADAPGSARPGRRRDPDAAVVRDHPGAGARRAALPRPRCVRRGPTSSPSGSASSCSAYP